jgi:ABC-type transporter Mla MlaB component
MTTPLALPAELTIFTVGELHPAWMAWLDAPGDTLVLDAAGVDEVDAAGVQLLIALQRGLARRERALVLHAPSTPLVTACTHLGASVLLNAPAPTETLESAP